MNRRLPKVSRSIVIIGAGLAGLAAALELEAAGEECLILEASAKIGGKLETETVNDAYLLDRGFQVLLPAYPELKRLGNLHSELDLKYFESGARLEMDGGPLRMANPVRAPARIFSTTFGNYATFKDKLLVLKLQAEVGFGPSGKLLASASETTLEYLRGYEFSEKIIEHFWRPFFAGIFLESDLATSAGYFKYLTRMFASSPVAVPGLGMGELPKLLAKRLTKTEIRLNTRVITVNDKGVKLETGHEIAARAVVQDSRGYANEGDSGPFGCVTSFWFTAPRAPFTGAWLSLNSRKGPRLINHTAVLSNVSPKYAAKGDALICVNVVAPQNSVTSTALKSEAEKLFGKMVKEWLLLRTDEIIRPFPLYLNRTDEDTPSQQGALARGRRAARAVLNKI